MAIPVLVLSKSGMGKSSSMKNFNHDEIALINVLGKPLPFETKFDSTLETADPETIKQALLKTEKKSIVIDDYGYVLTSMLMNQYGKGNNFDLYANIGKVSWELTEWVRSRLPEDKIVYMLMHEDYTDDGGVKPKTVGKMTDEKICLEGIFTIVLRGYFEDGRFGFLTQKQTFEDCIKTPIGMFEEKFIDNDLSMVDEKIRSYYKLPALGAK